MKEYCEDCQNIIIDRDGLTYAKCKAYPNDNNKLQFLGRKPLGGYRYCEHIRWRNGCWHYKKQE